MYSAVTNAAVAKQYPTNNDVNTDAATIGTKYVPFKSNGDMSNVDQISNANTAGDSVIVNVQRSLFCIFSSPTPYGIFASITAFGM